MRKEEFFKQLEYLLQDIPDEDREEALEYYRDYLAEAGSENEEQAIEEFGSPERVAAIIRADAAGNLKDGGSFTERGYEDERFRDPNYQVAKRLDLPDEKEPGNGGQNGGSQRSDYRNGGYQNGAYQNGGYQNGAYQNGRYQNGGYQNSDADGNYNHVKKPRSNRLLKFILWCVLIIAALPFVLGTAGIGLGGITGFLAVVFGILVSLVCLTAAAFIVGVILLALGIVFLFSIPFDGVMLIGIGIVGIGCGVIGVVILYAIVALLFPLVWKGIRMLIDAVTGKRREAKKS